MNWFLSFRPRLLEALKNYSAPLLVADLAARFTVCLVARPLALAQATASIVKDAPETQEWRHAATPARRPDAWMATRGGRLPRAELPSFPALRCLIRVFCQASALP